MSVVYASFTLDKIQDSNSLRCVGKLQDQVSNMLACGVPVFVVNKPLGLTSHDVVARARRLLKTKKIGHTGTLDPLATGVLLLCSESSTKLVPFMTPDSKDYLAWISLGAATVTLDAEGPISQLSELSQDLPSKLQLASLLTSFLGPQQQVPPQYSAIQVAGKRAYAVARAGGSLELPARDIVIHDLELLGTYPSLQAASTQFDHLNNHPNYPTNLRSSDLEARLPAALGEFPILLVRASVGSGTYLRSLARDIGAALGVPAHLAGLMRTRVGQYSLADAIELEELKPQLGHSDLSALTLPQLAVDAATASALRQGKRPSCDSHDGRYALTYQGQLVAVADAVAGSWKVVRAWL